MEAPQQVIAQLWETLSEPAMYSYGTTALILLG